MLDRDGNNGYEPNNNDDGYEAFVDADDHVEVGFHGNQVLHDDDFHEDHDVDGHHDNHYDDDLFAGVANAVCTFAASDRSDTLQLAAWTRSRWVPGLANNEWA